MSLKYNFSGIDGAASASTAELNYALKDLSIAVGPTDEAGSKGGKRRVRVEGRGRREQR
jgi:hypothetical protein